MPTAVDQNRIEWVDMGKAVAIFLVLFGHLVSNFQLHQYIYSFHLPLFFWISGYLFKIEKYPIFWGFFVRRFHSLMVPYFLFAIISFLFWFFVVRSMSMRGQSAAINPWYPFGGIFYGIGVSPWRNPMEVSLWFLPCLFSTEIVAWFVQRIFSGKRIIIGMLVCGIAGYCTSILLHFRLPWSIDVALTAVVFYILGNRSKSLFERLLASRWIWQVGILGILIVGSYFLNLANGGIDMNNNNFQNPVLFYASAVCGIYSWIYLIRFVPKNNLAMYIGRNTIVIIGLAGVSRFVINGVQYILLHRFSTTVGTMQAMIYSVLEIALLLPVIYLLNRYLPFLLGRRRIRSAA